MLHNAFVFIAGGKDARGNGEDRSPLAVRLAQRRNRRNYGTNRSQQTPSRLVFNCQFPFTRIGSPLCLTTNEKSPCCFSVFPYTVNTLVWNFHSIFFSIRSFKREKAYHLCHAILVAREIGKENRRSFKHSFKNWWKFVFQAAFKKCINFLQPFNEGETDINRLFIRFNDYFDFLRRLTKVILIRNSSQSSALLLFNAVTSPFFSRSTY